MALLLSAIVLTLLLLCIITIKRKSSRTARHKRLRKRHTSPFHAVEAHLHSGCCKAAKKLRGQRFLAADAPLFPLSDCNCKQCHCDYVHYDDRRQDSRRLDMGLVHDLYGKNGEPERREGRRRGRRKSD